VTVFHRGQAKTALPESVRRIRQELGYTEPVPLDVGISRTIKWERANPPAQVDPKQFDYAAEDAALAQLRLRGQSYARLEVMQKN
jgi:hypothetical protein